MGKYVYDKQRVDSALDRLRAATKSLDSIDSELSHGISVVTHAENSGGLNIDFSGILAFKQSVIDSINQVETSIKGKAQEIENYNNAPLYKKVLATIGMGALKLTEGIISAFGDLGDGVVSITGAVGGIFNPEFKEACAEFVKKEFVGDFFYEQYENGSLQWINQNSAMDHTSTAANVFKQVGVGTGYVIMSTALGATGMSTMAHLGASAAAVGVGNVGDRTESDLLSGLSFDEAFKNGMKQGAIAAGTTLVLGTAANKYLGGVSGGLGGPAAAAATHTAGIAANAAATFAGNLVAKSTDPKPDPAVRRTIAYGVDGETHKIEALTAKTADQILQASNDSIERSRAQEESFTQKPSGGNGGTPTGGNGGEPTTNPTPTVPNGASPATPTVPSKPSNPSPNPGPSSPSIPKPNPTPNPTPTPNPQPAPTPTPQPAPTPVDPILTPTPQPITTPNPITTSPLPENVSLQPILSDSLGSLETSSHDLSSLSGSLNTIIPTSSSPLSSGAGTTVKSSIIPIVAGLGAAAVAGLGTKTYIDKKEEKETSSDEETIATDEPINQIDVNYEDPEEASADYILPTDELAFEEN